MKAIIKPYKKEDRYTYTSGAYATIELLHARLEQAKAVYLRSACADKEAIQALCAASGVPVLCDDSAFAKVNQKENSYVLGLVEKYPNDIVADRPHVVLVNPADMGNLGTIIRTMVGFSFMDLAIIMPAADVWNPKTIRASMGALFHLRFSQYPSFTAYRTAYPAHRLYPFMPGGVLPLYPGIRPVDARFALVFGNEAAGLDAGFHHVGTSVSIPQSAMVDSLNLSIAAGVGMYAFSAGGKACPERQ